MYFTENANGNAVIERVPFESGGEATAVPGADVPNAFLSSTEIALSPDGKQIASIVSISDPATRTVSQELALANLGSAQPPHLIMMNQNFSNHGPVFTPDGKAVAYSIREKGVDNIWLQPITGSAGRQLTHFTSGQTNGFSWSPDGKKLAVLRSHTTSDVVLIRATQP